jgi:hypothetical protein
MAEDESTQGTLRERMRISVVPLIIPQPEASSKPILRSYCYASHLDYLRLTVSEVHPAQLILGGRSAVRSFMNYHVVQFPLAAVPVWPACAVVLMVAYRDCVLKICILCPRAGRNALKSLVNNQFPRSKEYGHGY